MLEVHTHKHNFSGQGPRVGDRVSFAFFLFSPPPPSLSRSSNPPGLSTFYHLWFFPTCCARLLKCVHWRLSFPPSSSLRTSLHIHLTYCLYIGDPLRDYSLHSPTIDTPTIEKAQGQLDNPFAPYPRPPPLPPFLCL